MVLDKSQGGGSQVSSREGGGALSEFLEKCSLRVDRLGGTSEWNIEQKNGGGVGGGPLATPLNTIVTCPCDFYQFEVLFKEASSLAYNL